MTDTTFGNISVVLGERNAQVRRTVADSLRQQGYRNTVDTDKVKEVRAMVEQDQVDVLICDADLGGDDICDLVRGVRHHEIGNNPFLVTIALTEDATPTAIGRLVDSGVDDIVLKPVSVGFLLVRLEYLTWNRKGFVVTTDYIGPDRRRSRRPGTLDIPVFDVPNPIRYKAEGGVNMAVYQQSVDAAARLVNDQKMERHAYQIDYLVERIALTYETGRQPPETPSVVARLLSVAEDLMRRMAKTERKHISALGGSIIDIASSISRTPMTPDMKDVRLLPELGAAIKQAFVADERTISVARDISASLEERMI